MLHPLPQASLQLRKFRFANPVRAWQVPLAIWAIMILGALGGAVVLFQSKGSLPGAVAGGLTLTGFAGGMFVMVIRRFQNLHYMSHIEGINPSVNRDLLKEWAKSYPMGVRAEEPDYLILDHPTHWYEPTFQITALYQGRNLWVHIVPRRKWNSVALLTLPGQQTRIRRSMLEAIHAQMAVREREG